MYAKPSRWARIHFAVWIGLIVLVVFPWYGLTNHSHWDRIRWIPFVSPPIRVRDILANVLLYVPFGFLYVRQATRRSVPKAVFLGFVISLVTEASQVYSHGRFPSTTDLLCNTAGAYIGATWVVARLNAHPPNEAQLPSR